MKTDPTFWLLARASGLTAYGLLTASVLAGLVLKSKPFGRALRPAPTMDVHRFLALLGLGMLVVHGATLLLDRTLHMPLAGLLVPGASPYRSAAVSAGVVAAELMALIYVSFALRNRIGPRNWRRLHYATFLVFLLATVHGFASGTDSAQPWAHDLYLGAVGAVAFATAWRTLGRPHTPRTRKEHMMYRISIDRSLCNGHGVCEAIAPDVFELGDDGLAVLHTAMSEDEAVQEACDSCPMGAISIARVEAA